MEELGRAVWGEGAGESHRNGERGRCELGLCVSFTVFEKCEQSRFASYLGVTFETNKASTGGHNENNWESLQETIQYNIC